MLTSIIILALVVNNTIVEEYRLLIKTFEAIGKLYWLGASFLLGTAFGTAFINFVIATTGLKESLLYLSVMY
jgi:hypothetical protein